MLRIMLNDQCSFLQDVPAERNSLEEANNLPEEKLMLSPGGCATYMLPIVREEYDDLFLMVQPGKKEGKYRADYKDKANISLTASVEDRELTVECSVSDTDASSQASDYCLLNITALADPDLPCTGQVIVCVPGAETRDASLWELWVSPEEDSRRAKGSFADAGRQRLGETEQSPEFNTWLTMTSVVGKTGVGKSTVASFLSGNMSMFTSASTSQGTTTVGTDMSPIIPSQDYTSVMAEKLQEGEIQFDPDLYIPAAARPLFFLDSEGMSFRGDEFDFITSGQ